MAALAGALLTSTLLGHAAPVSAGTTTPDNAYETTTDRNKRQWMEIGMEMVRARLKDPGAAQFRNVYFNKWAKTGAPFTCGEVNAKNAMGGYIGFKRFIAANKRIPAYFEQDFPEGIFEELWRPLCGQ